MSIQRFIHPCIWTSEDFCQVSVLARLVFIGCFSTADDQGRRKASPSSIKAEILPLEDCSTDDILRCRNELAARGMIVVYSGPDGVEYMHLPNWSKYQKPKYKKESKIPPPSPYCPPIVPRSGEDPGRIVPDVPHGLGRVGLGRVGKEKNTAATPRGFARGQIPECLFKAGSAVGLSPGVLGRRLKDGWTEEGLLPWLLAMAKVDGIKSAAAYLKGCTRKGVSPPDWAIAKAKAMLAETEKPTDPLFAGVLESPDVNKRPVGAKVVRRCRHCGVLAAAAEERCRECNSKSWKKE